LRRPDAAASPSAKRGFTNIFRTEYTVVNLDRIAETIASRPVGEIALEDYKKLGWLRAKRR